MSHSSLSRRSFLKSTSLLAGATVLGSSSALLAPEAVHAQTSSDDVATILKLHLQTEEVS